MNPSKQDKAQWMQLTLRKYERPLLRFTRRFLTTEKAQEVVQDAFLKLWKEDPEKIQNSSAWLYRVCRNKALDIIKKEGPMRPGYEEDSEVASDAPDASEQLEKKQQIRQMYSLIEQLPANEKEVIFLKFQEGLSYKEISEVTGQSTSHVGVLIHTAMKKLKANIPSDHSQAQEGGHHDTQKH